ncbi:MAG: hypothetical protein AAB116_12105 [Candidatus Poribacteria bacterium]
MKTELQVIRHRVNQVIELQTLESGWGAEIDLRSRGDNIILTHDAFTGGDRFEDFLKKWVSGYQRGTLILNLKEDGLESEVLRLLKSHKIMNYFFLDLSLPTIVRLAIKENIRNIAIRVSEYEPIEFAMKFVGKVDWVWLDTFSGSLWNPALVKRLSKFFRVCLVSPELQQYPINRIAQFKSLLPCLSAVCTKVPREWLT